MQGLGYENVNFGPVGLPRTRSLPATTAAGFIPHDHSERNKAMKLDLYCSALFTLILCSTPVPGESVDDLIVHEWGTFTSVQGSDGNLLDWQGAEIGELPAFVYDWANPGLERHANAMMTALFTKQCLPSLQRMETPVIYFYSDVPRTVDITIDFPQGKITEWYPQATEIGSSQLVSSEDFRAHHGAPAGVGSLICWSEVEVLPGQAGAAGVDTLPTGTSGNHYFAARATDSAMLRMSTEPDMGGNDEHEKFLFYRGVGRFGTPLTVILTNGLIHLSNTGTTPLRNLLALQVQGGQTTFTTIKELNPNATHSVRLDAATGHRTHAQTMAQISQVLEEALVGEGLFRREAEAMVNTWQDTWFEDPGVRILYILPRTWTDRTLPITINPEPTELARVMVGRAEVITPEMQEELCRYVRGFIDAGQANAPQALQQIEASGLGRFTVPALNLVINLNASHDSEFTVAASALREAVRAASEQPTSPPPAQTSSGRLLQKGG